MHIAPVRQSDPSRADRPGVHHLPLERHHRSVDVTVLDHERVVDSFEATDPEVLHEAVQLIMRELSPNERLVFTATEDSSLPFGIGARHMKLRLLVEQEAERFLAA
jgi:hypothetical protein